jgi:hypothetical protein
LPTRVAKHIQAPLVGLDAASDRERVLVSLSRISTPSIGDPVARFHAACPRRMGQPSRRCRELSELIPRVAVRDRDFAWVDPR